MRIIKHPILGDSKKKPKKITIYVDDEALEAFEGDTIASALMVNIKKVFRYTRKNNEPRGIFCGIGRCSDCLMTVDGVPNVRSCVTPVRDGMKIQTQKGNGTWEGLENEEC